MHLLQILTRRYFVSEITSLVIAIDICENFSAMWRNKDIILLRDALEEIKVSSSLQFSVTMVG